MILTIISAVIIFSVLIFVHELGHFLAARAFKIKVLEFALGMGPAIWKRKKGETLYALRAIPMGGFCKMEGEDETSEDEGAFNNKPWWARFIVLFAGGFMNVLLGFIVCIVMVLMTGGVSSPVVDSVIPDTDAAGFVQKGDRIVAINSAKTNIYYDINFEMQQIKDHPFELTVKRDDELLTKKIIPYKETTQNGEIYYRIGVATARPPLNFASVMRESFFRTVWMAKLVLVSLKMLITGQVAVSEVSGPVGVVGAISTAARSGLLDLLFLAAFIAINLGMFNLLPLPALDGGRILFVLIEGIRRKPLNPEREGIVHFIGFALLILLMLFATYNDIIRLVFKT